MSNYFSIFLTRDCNAIKIPDGTFLIIKKGCEVFITQQLGDTFTVETEAGFLVRIHGKDSDALGLEIPKVAEHQDWNKFNSLIDSIWFQLKTCYDPEIPVNIVDLGLIYEVKVKNGHVLVSMTLTAPGCGMAEVLRGDIIEKLSLITNVASVTIDLTFTPPWNVDMMSYSAKLQLGML